MKTGTILDADMATIGRHVADAMAWWLDELATMLPGLAARNDKKISGRVIHYGLDGAFRMNGVLAPLRTNHWRGNPRSATILLPDALPLVRKIHVPAMRQADLRKLVTLDLDRLMPFAADTAYADAVATGVHNADGKVEVMIAAVPKSRIMAIHAQACEHGLMPRALGIADDTGQVLRFDFLPALAADGVATKSASGVSFWWGLVVALFALNSTVLIFRDVERVAHVATLVDLQRPSVIAARRLAKHIADRDAARLALMARRQHNDALAALAFVTRTIPKGAWIQRYNATGETLRLAGYMQANVDVVAALRKSGRFAAVRASTSDLAAESVTGQPFDITADWQKAGEQGVDGMP